MQEERINFLIRKYAYVILTGRGNYNSRELFHTVRDTSAELWNTPDSYRIDDKGNWSFSTLIADPISTEECRNLQRIIKRGREHINELELSYYTFEDDLKIIKII